MEKLNYQNHYSSLQCHTILQIIVICWFAAQETIIIIIIINVESSCVQFLFRIIWWI